MNADTLADAIRQQIPPMQELLDSGLSNSEANAIRAIYALPIRKKRLSMGGGSALHEFLERFDTSKLELPTLTFIRPVVRGSEVRFARREADVLVLDDTGVFIVSQVTGERERVALNGDRFVRALIRLVRASNRPVAWSGRFDELLDRIQRDAGVQTTNASLWPAIIHPTIATSSNPPKRTRR